MRIPCPDTQHQLSWNMDGRTFPLPAKPDLSALLIIAGSVEPFLMKHQADFFLFKTNPDVRNHSAPPKKARILTSTISDPHDPKKRVFWQIASPFLGQGWSNE